MKKIHVGAWFPPRLAAALDDCAEGSRSAALVAAVRQWVKRQRDGDRQRKARARRAQISAKKDPLSVS